MKKKKYDDDDGRSIADMSLTHRTHVRSDIAPPPSVSSEDSKQIAAPPLTKRERNGLILNALLAASAIAGVFLLGAVLFVLFCIFVWFK